MGKDKPAPPDKNLDMTLQEATCALLDQVGATFDRHVVFPSQEARDAACLWVLHAHVYEAFDTTPRLSVRSTQPGSGKSVVLEIVEHLSPRGFNSVLLTPGVLWRIMEHEKPTLILDEADTIFGKSGSSSSHSELRGVINAGHKKGGTVPRCKGSDDVKPFNVFGPVAMAGLGRLPETIATRSVEIVMKRIPMMDPKVKIQPLRMRFAEANLQAIRSMLEVWGKAALPRLAASLPELPVKARAADVWEPLVAVADMAGMDWPERSRKACVELSGAANAEKTADGVQMLADLRTVFDSSGADKLFSQDVVTALVNLQGVWDRSNLTATKLATFLREYGVSSKMIRNGELVQRGYTRDALEPAWKYYAPSLKVAKDREEVAA